MAVINKIEKIARDLTHLEINTIIKPGMTGRKMPRPRIALIEIARRYYDRLVLLDAPLAELDAPMGSYHSYEIIKNAAHALFEEGARRKRADTAEDEKFREGKAILLRISGLSEQIMEIMRHLKKQGVETWDNALTQDDIEALQTSLPLKTEELVRIRKAWEMGLEEIAMQTIVQIDGDVFTRIHPRYAAEAYEALQQIHNDNIKLSTGIWSNLIHTVKDFFSNVGNKTMKRK